MVNVNECDLVIAMDEIQDQHKLLEFRRRADPSRGVMKYLAPDTPAEYRKYSSLFNKMSELIALESRGQISRCPTEIMDEVSGSRAYSATKAGNKHREIMCVNEFMSLIFFLC